MTSKDIVLFLIRTIGTAGGNGHAIEFAGSYIESISMEARMTICNMSIEAGAKVGLIAPDATTFNYVKDHSQLSEEEFEDAMSHWTSLVSDNDASFDKEIEIDVSLIKPQVTWGTSPEMVVDFDQEIPNLDFVDGENKRNFELAKKYMGIEENQKVTDLKFDRVFIGSCTNSRIEDLRDAAKVVDGKKVSEDIIEAIVVPGSGLVKEQAESEGLNIILKKQDLLERSRLFNVFRNESRSIKTL